MSVEQAKARLRVEMRKRRRGLPLVQRLEAGAAVTRRILASPEFHRARRVALYAALADEVPTDRLLEAVLDAGRTLLLPRAGSTGRLEFAVSSSRDSLVRGRFGALEPPRSSPGERLLNDDLVLVPGLAFDRSGGRLGRGGGWYDRSLPVELQAVYGIGFAFEILESVPMTPRDRRVAGIFTEQELWRVGPAGGGGDAAGNSG